MGMECFQIIACSDKARIDYGPHGFTVDASETKNSFMDIVSSIKDLKYVSEDDSLLSSEKYNKTGIYLRYHDENVYIQLLISSYDLQGLYFESISIRFALCNPLVVVEKVCEILSKVELFMPIQIFVPVFGAVLPVNKEMKNKLGRLIMISKEKFVNIFGNFEKPLPCGTKFFNFIKNKKIICPPKKGKIE